MGILGKQATRRRPRAIQGLWLAFALATTFAHATETSPEEFDRAYRAIYGPQSYDRSPAHYRQLIFKLRAMLPPNDPARAIRLVSAECAEGAWWEQPAATRQKQLDDALAKVGNDHEAAAHLYACEAWQRSTEGRDSLALAASEKSVTAAQKVKLPLVQADALVVRAYYHSSLGDQSSALVDYAEASRLMNEAGLKVLPDTVILRRAAAYRRLGDLNQARQQLSVFEQRANHTVNAETRFAYLMEHSFIELDANQPAVALADADKALALLSPIDKLLRGNALLARARAYIGLKRYDAALADLAQISSETGSPVDRALELLVRGHALDGLGRHDEALKSLAEAEKLFRQDPNPRYLSWLHEVRAHAHESVGNVGAALADYREYIRLRDQVRASMSGQQDRLRLMEQEIVTRNTENEALRKQKEVLERVRTWQTTAMTFAGLLIAMLAYTILLQLRRGRQLRQLADFDTLTGVASRARVLAQARQALDKAQAEHTPLCILVLDIDHFKEVNDQYGHPFGDLVLIEVTRVCQEALRSTDVMGRAGGEEFFVICPGTKLEDARGIAHRMLQAVRALPKSPRLDALPTLTVSIGIAEMSAQGEKLETLIQRADQALYRAKHNGRDRAEVSV